MKMPKMYYGALAVFCILTLVINMAGATDMIRSTPQSTHFRGSGHSCADPMNVTMQQQVMARFEKQGADVTGFKAAFQNGDTAAVKNWSDNHRQADKAGSANGTLRLHADLTNTTMQQQVIARFEKQGVDVTGLKAAFGKGDTTAVKTWFDAYRKAHPGEMPSCAMRGHRSPKNT